MFVGTLLSFGSLISLYLISFNWHVSIDISFLDVSFNWYPSSDNFFFWYLIFTWYLFQLVSFPIGILSNGQLVSLLMCGLIRFQLVSFLMCC